MVGRADPLARLRQAADEARTGRPRAVLVTGEAGIGRTRFVTEASEALTADGWLVVHGAAVRSEGGAPPFLPFVQVLGEIVAATDPARRSAILGPVRDDLVRLMPELAAGGTRPPSSVEDHDDPGPLRQARLFEGVLDIGERVAAIQPLCVVVEDLQWLDRSSADLLRFFVGHAETGRLLLIATARTGDDAPDGSHGLLVDLARPATTWLDLPRLADEDVQRLVAGRVGPTATTPTVEAIARRSDGVPLLAIELADAHARGETSSRSVEAVLMARLDALPHPAADVVRAAALLAPTIDELVRELAERSLLPAQRRRIHRAVAEAAEREPTDTPLSAAERARHWAAAGVPARALRAAVEAQADAEAVGAHEAVLRAGDLSLLLWPHVAASDREGLERSLVERRSADAALCLADPVAAVGYLRSAVAETNGLAREELRGRLRMALFEAGDPAAVMADAQDALAAPLGPGGELWRAEALLHLAGLALAARAWAEARRLASDADALLADADDPAVAVRRALAAGIGGLASVELGDVEAGLAAVEAAWRVAPLAGARGFDVAYRRYVGVLRRLGRFERVLAVADEGREVAAAAGLARTLGQTLAVDAAEALLELGRWEEAADRLGRLPWTHGPPGPTDRRPRVEALLRLRADGPDAAADLVAAAGPDVAAEAALLSGDPGRASRHLAPYPAMAATAGAWPAELAPEAAAVLAAWAAAEGDTTAGPDVLAALAPLLVLPLGPFAPYLAAQRGDGSWSDAADTMAGHHLPWWEGWARLHAAEGAAAGGDGEAMRAGVAAAWGIAESLASRPLRLATERLARRLGTALPTAPPTEGNQAEPARHGAHLTDRERTVLTLLVEGYSNREIADRLGISHKTASVHVSNILAKLEVDNRTQAAAVAVRLGLTTAPPDARG
jgi:DNA-binding CsgD family transcriptional regulator